MKTTSNKVCLALLSMTLAFTAIAADKGGNGGDAVVCDDGRVFLLDSYEAQKRNFPVSLPGNSLKEKVLALTSRLSSFDSLNGKAVEKMALAMVEDMKLASESPSAMKLIALTTDELVDIQDSLETSIPRNCVKEQLVINKQVVYSQDKKFELRIDLWKKMDLTNQALTITHESIYNWLVEAGADDSRFARYLNGYFSQELSRLDYAAYMTDLKKQAKFGVKIFYVFPGMRLMLKTDTTLLDYISVNDNIVALDFSTTDTADYYKYFTMKFKSEYRFQGQSFTEAPDAAAFDNRGQLISQKFDVTYPAVKLITVSNGSIQLTKNISAYSVTTNSAKQVSSFYSKNGIKNVEFNSRIYTKVTEVNFNDQGEIVSVK